MRAAQQKLAQVSHVLSTQLHGPPSQASDQVQNELAAEKCSTVGKHVAAVVGAGHPFQEHQKRVGVCVTKQSADVLGEAAVPSLLAATAVRRAYLPHVADISKNFGAGIYVPGHTRSVALIDHVVPPSTLEKSWQHDGLRAYKRQRRAP